MKKIILTAAALTLIPFAANAQNMPPIQDSISLELRAETWVTTARALVQVSVTAAGDAAKAASVREDMVKALGGLVKDAQWRPVSLSRNTDEAGLERWFAVYEARIAESSLAGLTDKAKTASRAGLQLSIASVQFTPEMAEIEAARQKLRTDLYKQAQGELARLNESLPGRNFRISNIGFSGSAMPMAAPMMARAEGMAVKMNAQMADMAAASSNGGADMSVDMRMEQSAYVTLSANGPAAVCEASKPTAQ